MALYRARSSFLAHRPGDNSSLVVALTVKGQDQSFLYDGRQSIVYGRPDVDPVSSHGLNTLQVGRAERSMSEIGILRQLRADGYPGNLGKNFFRSLLDIENLRSVLSFGPSKSSTRVRSRLPNTFMLMMSGFFPVMGSGQRISLNSGASLSCVLNSISALISAL